MEIPSIQELKVVLLHGADGTAEQRKVLRRELVRWHPDKFVAKFGRWLIPGEKERILQRVNGISQVLNALHAEIQAKK